MRVALAIGIHSSSNLCSSVPVGNTPAFLKKIRIVLFCAIALLSVCITPALSFGSVIPEYQRLSSLTKKINSPISVASDSSGKMYVANSQSNEIIIFNQQGQDINSIKDLASPISVAVDKSGNVYVGNEVKGNVEVFDNNLNFQHKLGSRDGEFGQPNDIAIDNYTGTVYVADQKNNVVGMYNTAGEFIRNLGEPGEGDGQFSSPRSVAIDVNGQEILVLDRALINTGGMMGSWVPGARIQFFSMAGTFLRSFNRYGSAIGDLVMPQRVEVDQQSRLYVTDSYQNIVLVYDNVGNYLGPLFDSDNPLRTPLGVTLDSTNKLYIASRIQKRVDVYGLDDFFSMSAAPASLSFSVKESEKESAPQAITVHNNGNKSFVWSAVAHENWIAIPDNLGVVDIGQKGTIDVNVDTAGIKAGEYLGSISIFVGAVETAVINVSLTVQKAPKLSVTPLTLEFTHVIGSTPLSQSVFIANTGSESLSWSMAADQAWITLSSVTGVLHATESGASEIAVLPDIESLEAGSYNSTIAVIGQNAVASPMFISVVLTLTDPPAEPTDPPGGTVIDSDNDGTPDSAEACPLDPDKLEPGICGCGIADEDTDNNGIIDCLEKKKHFFPIHSKGGAVIWLVF